MGSWIELTAGDGVTIGAWRADPVGTPQGGLVVLQEIFGVNAHIRAVAEGFAAEGYLAIAPALFDRAERGVELGYEPPDFERARALRGQVPLDGTMADIAAAVAVAAEAGKVGIVGYCWGGSLAARAACHIPGLSAAVGYYGGGIPEILKAIPRVPLILHYGELDEHIPLSDAAEIRAAHPELSVYTYPADHGFNCDRRASYDAASATLALERTLRFFAEKLG